ncbi:MAG: preprotein translocase subunit SecE [Marmoricola sp.]
MAESSSARSGKSERTSPITFYRQIVAELRKVVYPSQQQLVTYFIVVMVFVLVMIALVSVLDLGFGKAVFWLFGNDK